MLPTSAQSTSCFSCDHPESASGLDTTKVVLINPYELGRQPFALAEPAAWLRAAGFDVTCIDLSLQKLDPQILSGASLIALFVGMHTATRIALEALPRIRETAPAAHLCVYGLYAPMNEALLRSVGVHTVLGGEVEPALLRIAERLRRGEEVAHQIEPVVQLGKVDFLTPDRHGLPALARYAHLVLPDRTTRMAGFAEGSRGCKHLCRHCPVVPVYQGKFRIVPVDVVMADIRQQVAAGAQHISFGDPDFLNGPTHGMKLVRALHEEFPDVSYDVTIKIQHLIEQADLLPELKRTGCLFITSAVEAVDDSILGYLAKQHTRADFEIALQLCRDAGIALAPTFVAFTPWTSLQNYRELLATLLRLHLVEAVPPIQLSIRLLVPEGSYLLQLENFRNLVEEFDPALLGYPWTHADRRVDALQRSVQAWVAEAEKLELPRGAIFQRIWEMTHEALGQVAPSLDQPDFGAPIPRMSEPWYCCAEPTNQQLQSF